MRLAPTVLAALLLCSYERGRVDERRKSAAGYSQEAANGYEEGAAEARRSPTPS